MLTGVALFSTIEKEISWTTTVCLWPVSIHAHLHLFITIPTETSFAHPSQVQDTHVYESWPVPLAARVHAYPCLGISTKDDGNAGSVTMSACSPS